MGGFTDVFLAQAGTSVRKVIRKFDQDIELFANVPALKDLPLDAQMALRRLMRNSYIAGYSRRIEDEINQRKET